MSLPAGRRSTKRRPTSTITSDLSDSMHLDAIIANACDKMNAMTRHDTWDNLGEFVASRGRDIEKENPILASEFRNSIINDINTFSKLQLEEQRKAKIANTTNQATDNDFQGFSNDDE